jgi:hypothetical protein
MIAPMIVACGKPVIFTGYADDYGKRITAVQFSLDEGENWTTFCTPDASEDLWVHWTFEYTPEQPGHYRFKVRSVNEDGSTSPEAAVAELYCE